MDLQRILLVKGISDWSIERIVEQTIVRGGIAIVHLEECPPDFQLQEDLFGMGAVAVNVCMNIFQHCKCMGFWLRISFRLLGREVQYQRYGRLANKSTPAPGVLFHP